MDQILIYLGSKNQLYGDDYCDSDEIGLGIIIGIYNQLVYSPMENTWNMNGYVTVL